MAGWSHRNYIYTIFFFFANAKSFLRKYIFPLSKARMTSCILLLLLWWVHTIFITFFNFLHLAKKSWKEMVRLNLSKNFSTKINSLENGMENEVCSIVPTFYKPLSLLLSLSLHIMSIVLTIGVVQLLIFKEIKIQKEFYL